jgi:hypothetical protein
MRGFLQIVGGLLVAAPESIRRRLLGRLGDESGQSTVEYAYIAFAILAGGLAAGPWMIELIKALQRYYSGVYWVIQFPFP